MISSRRTFIVAAAGLVFARPALAGVLTPDQTRGPFYPRIKPADQDLDLTRIKGRDTQAQGEVIELSGRVMRANGNPVGDALVEIWQANAFGDYAYRGSTVSDPNFQGFGTVRTGADGAYRFRTVKPKYYGSGGSRRTPHIHFRVVVDGRELVTQMYFPGEPLNAGDGLYNRLSSDALRQAATAVAGGEGRYGWDIVVA